MTKHRRLLYPTHFVKKVPKPERFFEDRYLVKLLKGDFYNPQELECLERWYRELQSDHKKDLKMRLQSFDNRKFYSAVTELATSRVCVERGWKYKHGAFCMGKCPDFVVTPQDRQKFILEVVTVFEDQEKQKQREILRDIARQIKKEFPNVSILFDAKILPQRTINISALLPSIKSWVDDLVNGGNKELEIDQTADSMRLKLKLCYRRLDNSTEKIPDDMLIPAGQTKSPERILGRIREKVKKYREVQAKRIPFVIFVWRENDFDVTPFSFESAVLGQMKISITRSPEEKSIVLRTQGAFYDSATNPQNTRLSAIAFCKRERTDDKVFAQMHLYHNPDAAQPLSDRFFKGVPQLLPQKVTDKEIIMKWDKDPESAEGILLT